MEVLFLALKIKINIIQVEKDSQIQYVWYIQVSVSFEWWLMCCLPLTSGITVWQRARILKKSWTSGSLFCTASNRRWSKNSKFSSAYGLSGNSTFAVAWNFHSNHNLNTSGCTKTNKIKYCMWMFQNLCLYATDCFVYTCIFLFCCLISKYMYVFLLIVWKMYGMFDNF